MNDEIRQEPDEYRHTEQSILGDVPVPRDAADDISRGKGEQKCEESEDEIYYFGALQRVFGLEETQESVGNNSKREQYLEEIRVIQRERSLLGITIREVDTLETVVGRRENDKREQ